jgi:orotate phosphoribosyltransferase
VRAIRAAGGRAHHAFVIFDYGIFPQSIATLGAEQVQLHALATWWDVLGVAEGLGYFNPGQFAAVKSFLENPEGWSAPGQGSAG